MSWKHILVFLIILICGIGISYGCEVQHQTRVRKFMNLAPNPFINKGSHTHNFICDEIDKKDTPRGVTQMRNELENIVGRGFVRIVGEVSVPRGRFGPCIQDIKVFPEDGDPIEVSHSWLQYQNNPELKHVNWIKGQQVEFECEVGQYRRHDGSESFNFQDVRI